MTEPIDTTEPVDTAEAEGVISDADRERLDLERQLSDTAEERDSLRGTLARREQTIADLQLASLKRDVAEETGVHRDLLSGKNREELTAHADKLKAWAQSQQRVSAAPHSGQLRSGAGRPVSDKTARELAIQAFHLAG